MKETKAFPRDSLYKDYSQRYFVLFDVYPITISFYNHFQIIFYQREHGTQNAERGTRNAELFLQRRYIPFILSQCPCFEDTSHNLSTTCFRE